MPPPSVRARGRFEGRVAPKWRPTNARAVPERRPSQPWSDADIARAAASPAIEGAERCASEGSARNAGAALNGAVRRHELRRPNSGARAALGAGEASQQTFGRCRRRSRCYEASNVNIARGPLSLESSPTSPATRRWNRRAPSSAPEQRHPSGARAVAP